MDIKQTFILQALAEYNERCIAQMHAAMKQLDVGVTGEGYNSLAYQVFQQGAGAYSNLSFREYLRMVDMGAGRSHPLGGLKAVAVVLQSKKEEGLKLVKDRKRRPKKIYSKIVYGELGYLHAKLSYGFTEDTIAMLKQQIENQNN